MAPPADTPHVTDTADPAPQIVHGTCVAVDDRAVLIQGPSGTGKSALALQMMGMGAGLVADDRTRLRRSGEALIADAPPAIRGQIEARGVGILRAPSLGPSPLVLVVDLGEDEPERLPYPRTTRLLGIELPQLRKTAGPHFPAALMIYLRGGPLE